MQATPVKLVSMDSIIETNTDINQCRLNLIPHRHRHDSINDIMYEYIDRFETAIPRTDSEIIQYIDNHIEELESESVLTPDNLRFYDSVSDAIRTHAINTAYSGIDDEIYKAGIKALTAQIFKDCKCYTVPMEIWETVLEISREYNPDGKISDLVNAIRTTIWKYIRIVG